MQGRDIWWSYWYFHFGNYALALLFWTLIGRWMMGFFLPPDSPNYIYRWFRRLTDWLMPPVTFITPSIMPPAALPLVAAFWVAMARVAFF
jgi:YggT family protein